MERESKIDSSDDDVDAHLDSSRALSQHSVKDRLLERLPPAAGELPPFSEVRGDP